MNNRPAISEHIKREIRQRCGFGCIICGNPIYDYHHMEEWAKTQRHQANEITLLCSNHHAEVTRKLLPAPAVSEANKNPYNLSKGRSSNYALSFKGSKAKIIMGGLHFITIPERNYTYLIPILFNGRPVIMFTIKDEECLLNFVLFDKHGNPILKIENNILVYKIGAWDILFKSNKLTIREKARDIFLTIQFLTPDTIIIERAKIYFDKQLLLIKKDDILFHDESFSKTKKRSIQIEGFTLQAPIAISIGNDMRYPALFKFPTSK